MAIKRIQVDVIDFLLALAEERGIDLINEPLLIYSIKHGLIDAIAKLLDIKYFILG